MSEHEDLSQQHPDEEDPCCLLYREPYPQDHEYDCLKAIAQRAKK
jgi:hypothetical protein